MFEAQSKHCVGKGKQVLAGGQQSWSWRRETRPPPESPLHESATLQYMEFLKNYQTMKIMGETSNNNLGYTVCICKLVEMLEE